MIALTPLSLWTILNQNGTKRHLHFFTIKESMQGASVHTVDPVNIENIYFHSTSILSWDV